MAIALHRPASTTRVRRCCGRVGSSERGVRCA
jgi:hypothetical protein